MVRHFSSTSIVTPSAARTEKYLLVIEEQQRGGSVQS